MGKLKTYVNMPLDENIVLEENASLTIITFNNDTKGLLNNLTATLKKNAELNIYNIATTSCDYDVNQKIVLEEPSAKCNIMNVLLVKGNAKFKAVTNIDHLVKNTESEFCTYAIAEDSAVMTLDNNATIKKGASKAVCHQKAKGLTLSTNAKIKAMPNLYIDEYDVVANHAASIGSISKEDLFYLMSRGLSLKEASKIIVLGFINPVLDHINDENLKSIIKENFEKELSI